MKIIHERKNIFLLRAILTGTFMLFMFCLRYTHIPAEKKSSTYSKSTALCCKLGKKVLIDLLV